MHSPFQRLILRALFLIALTTTVASCGAGPPNQESGPVKTPRSASRAVRSAPVPTAPSTTTPIPSISPSPTPTPTIGSPPFTIGPIELRAPREPVQLEAQIKSIEVKPFEIKPVQVQLPKEELHVTASGIPEKITLAWEVKSVPLDVHWPKDPLNVSIDLKNAPTGPKDNESQKVIDTFSQLNRECKEQLSDLNKKLACAQQKEKQLQTTVDSSNKQNNTCNEKVTDLNNKLADADKQLAQERENHRKDLEQLHKNGMLSKEQYDEILRQRDLPRVEWWGSPLVIIGFIVAAGFVGGFSLSIVESLRERSERRQELVSLESMPSSTPSSASVPSAGPEKSDEERLRDEKWESELSARLQRKEELEALLDRPWFALSKWLPTSLLGIVAALMVPAALRLWGIKIEAVSQNAYSLVTLCSFCFVYAMLGEPFIDGFLRFARRWLGEVGQGSKASQSESTDKKTNTEQQDS
jgi:hypothetical protein